MLGSKVSDCYASGRGGGIYGMGRGASTRAYARTGKFGPLESSDGFDAIGSEIVGNVAGVHGGGLYVEHGLAVTLFATLIANNQALDGDGGGFCFAQTPVKVGGNARIEGNAAPRGFGGGFLVDAAAVCASGSFSPIGAVVVGNVARSGGGGAEIWAGDDVWATVYNATRALEPLVDVRGVRAYVAAKTNRLARMSILIDAHISVDYLYGFFGGHGLGWGAGKPYVQLETRRGAPRIKDLEDVDVLRPGTHAEEISLSLAWTDLVDDYEQELGFAQALRHWDCARVANATAGLDCEGVAGALAALAALVDVDGALRWINPDAFYDGMAHAPGRSDGRGAPDTSWIFERNEATDGDGGALHIGRGGRAYLDTVTCRGNAAGARGGCVHVEALATLELTRADVTGNAAGDEGGGVSATTLATVFAADVRVADNTARRGGGAAFATCEAVRLSARRARNAAVEEGGGLFVAETPRIDLDECRVEANEATGPGASDGGLATARAACRGCACFADPYGGFSRYVAVSRDGAEVERLTPRAGAVVAYDRCLPPGRYAFRAGPRAVDGVAALHVDVAVGGGRRTAFERNAAPGGGGGAVYFREAASAYNLAAALPRAAYAGNEAAYGPEVATPAVALVAATADELEALRAAAGGAPGAADAAAGRASLAAALAAVVDAGAATHDVALRAPRRGAPRAEPRGARERRGGNATDRGDDDGWRLSERVHLAAGGVAAFEGLAVQGPGGGRARLVFSAPALGSDITESSSFQLAVSRDCPEGYRESSRRGTLYCEPCTAGEYWAGGGCLDCPRGARCAVGATVGTLEITRGYWRSGERSDRVEACFRRRSCVGGGACAEGYLGPLCNACGDGFHAVPWRTTVGALDCARCPGPLPTAAAACLVGFLVVAAALAGRAYVATGLESARRRVRGLVAPRFAGDWAAPTSWLKIVWATYQIVSQSDWATNTAYPPPFAYSNAVLSVVELDVAAMTSFACTLDFDALDRMVLAAVAPSFGLALLFLAGRVLPLGGDQRRRLASLVLLVTFATLPTVSTPAFRTFPCRDFDGGIRVLEADYGVSCRGRRYGLFRLFAAIVVACSFLILFLCSTRFLDVPRVLLGFVALVANLAVLAGLSLSRYLEEQRKRRVEADAFEASFRECELDYDRMMQNDIIDRLLAERRGGAPAPDCASAPSSPTTLLRRVAVAADAGRLVSHGRAKRLGLLEELTATSRSPHSAASFFVSHEWEGADHPDNHANTKLRWLQSLDRHVGVGHAEVWIWLDYLCVPQEPGAKRRRALASLCCYANLCSRFVPLVRSPAAWSRLYGHGAEPPGALPGTLHSYLARAWSRLELCAALSPKYGRGGAGWRPGPRNVRFRCHEDPASPGVGPRVTTKHLLPPLAGVFDRGDDRVLAARLVAALGRIFEECRLQFEAAERRGPARSPRNPLRAVDLGGPDAGAVPRWLLGAATGRAAMPTFVDYGAGAGADAADADEAGIEVDVGEFAGDAQASETLLQGYLGLPVRDLEALPLFALGLDGAGRVAFASRGARSAAAVRRGAALDDLEFRSAGDLGHARREIRRVVEAARAPRPFTLWLRRPGGGEFASVVVHALRFGGAGGAARVALVGNVLSDAQLREAVALSDAAARGAAPSPRVSTAALSPRRSPRVSFDGDASPGRPGLLRRVAADARGGDDRPRRSRTHLGAAPAAAPAIENIGDAMDRLEIESARSRGTPRDARDEPRPTLGHRARRRGRRGRLQYTSATSFIVKAATVDARAYEDARSAVLVAMNARQRFREAKAELRASAAGARARDDARRLAAEARLHEAHLEYSASKASLRGTAALETFLRGKRERRALRGLGIFDDRWPRLYARLRLVEIGRADTGSVLSLLPRDIALYLLEFLLMRPGDLGVARARRARSPRDALVHPA
ncbi:hypothetical protein JL720_10666 [Aureococcus anophagefferens]|nr:hypothetical protein JL720_10666 [Aureococcus anophagefferens]